MKTLASLVRFVAIIATAILFASFATFAWVETGTASKGQTAAAAGQPAQLQQYDARGRPLNRTKMRIRIDSANDQLTAPIENQLHSENRWIIRGVPFLLGVLFWGLGGLLLARTLEQS